MVQLAGTASPHLAPQARATRPPGLCPRPRYRPEGVDAASRRVRSAAGTPQLRETRQGSTGSGVSPATTPPDSLRTTHFARLAPDSCRTSATERLPMTGAWGVFLLGLVHILLHANPGFKTRFECKSRCTSTADAGLPHPHTSTPTHAFSLPPTDYTPTLHPSCGRPASGVYSRLVNERIVVALVETTWFALRQGLESMLQKVNINSSTCV